MSFLDKIKLSKKLERNIESDLEEFYIAFSEKVSNRTMFFKFEQADIIFNSDKDLIGFVEKDSFMVRLNHKNRWFKISGFPTIAKGSIEQKGNGINLVCKISPINFHFKLYYAILILFLLFTFLGLLTSEGTIKEILIGVGIILFFVVFGLFIPFFTMQKDVENLYEYMNTRL
ncbi:hypothetical protein [Leeuwenhoekiella sp. H156]|uniref:hypothetical protein n=1 Tax=Leeuwenhoekiella sp. H156 TaxID=3450128 RepID=UPI003FA4A8D2